jgi:hypothetical protein
MMEASATGPSGTDSGLVHGVEAMSSERWHPWRVAPNSGFEVFGTDGSLGLVQTTAKNFLAVNRFRFNNGRFVDDLIDRLVRDGRTPEVARAAVNEARCFEPTADNPTDLASIPRFIRWFESPYGLHTLAAILHDDQIKGEVNAGSLGSDVRADRFFREMMHAAGTPWLKRWIIWSAVALRTRWAARGWRRVAVAGWVITAATGSVLFIVGVQDCVRASEITARGSLLVGGAMVMPTAAGLLWGRQYVASLIGAFAAIVVLPAAAIASIGYLAYMGAERVLRTLRLR